ncbi:MAG: hypothetical protein DRI61_10850 [Chloroflexi bacterium]|nr:MAG: hypothetical protein DRI61_10850 [Chloroflexota bacterium]HDN80213.1 UPF0175 family protein [Chloroflexota bacterium]
MKAIKEQVKVEIDFPPETFTTMRVIGLEGEKLIWELKKAMALHLFRKGLLSIGKAAELAELCLADFIELLIQEGMPIATYTLEELEKDLQAFERLER